MAESSANAAPDFVKLYAVIVCFLASLLTFGSVQQVAAQPVGPPDFLCLGVDAGGIPTFNWAPPADPNNYFVDYTVYVANAYGGPYTPYQTVNVYGATQVIGPFAISTSNSSHFFVRTNYNDGSGTQPSVSSDTLHSLFVTVGNDLDPTTNLPSGFANVQWSTYVSDVLLPSSQFELRKRIGPLNPWVTLGTFPVGTNFYFDPDKTCSDSLYYNVRISDQFCTSISNNGWKHITDQSEPLRPVVDSVSVDTSNGKVRIGWQASPTGDAGGYIVQRQITTLLDTVYGRWQKSFYSVEALANLQPEAFGIAVFDTCGVDTLAQTMSSAPNTSGIGLPHTTAFLQVDVNSCDKEMTLFWTPYLGWPDDLAGYQIWMRENSDPWTLVTMTDTATFEYTLSGLTPNANYCYFLKVIGNGRTSSSNKVCRLMSSPDVPSKHYLKAATVRFGHVELYCHVDTTAEILHYSVQRSRFPDSLFSQIGIIATATDTIIRYIDKTANTDSAVYYYRIAVLDVCSTAVIHSNVANNILLRANLAQASFRANISWNDYIGWDTLSTEVGDFTLYRGTNGVIDPAPFQQFGGEETTYTDNITALAEEGGQICYYLRAIESPGSPIHFRDTVKSNVRCIYAEPRVYIPTAFVPDGDGDNDVWLPIVSYANHHHYLLKVFNRLGNVVFETSNIDKGWDGLMKSGQLAPTGVYPYVLVFRNGRGENVEKRGTVTLIR